MHKHEDFDGSIKTPAAPRVLPGQMPLAPALLARLRRHAESTCQYSETCILLCLGCLQGLRVVVSLNCDYAQLWSCLPEGLLIAWSQLRPSQDSQLVQSWSTLHK